MDSKVEQQYREGLAKIYGQAASENKLSQIKKMVEQKLFVKMIFGEVDEAAAKRMMQISDEVADQLSPAPSQNIEPAPEADLEMC